VVAMLGCTAAIAAVEPAEIPVTIGNVDLVSPGGAQLLDGALTLHPKALAGAGWDSNPEFTNTSNGSPFLRLGAGLDAGLKLDALRQITLRSEYLRQDYDPSIQAPTVTYLAELRAAQDGRDLDADLGLSVRRIDDRLPDLNERISRVVASGDAGATRHWSSVQGGLRLGYERTSYLEDSSTFTAADRDNRLATVTGSLRYPDRDDPAGILLVDVDQRHFDTNIAYNDATGTSLLVGIAGSSSDRLRYQILAGPQLHNYSDNFRGDPAYNDSRVATVRIDGNATWQWSNASSLRLGLVNKLDDGTQANAVRALHTTAELRTRLAARLRTAATANWDRSVASGAPAGAQLDRRWTTALRLTLTWEVQRNLVIEAAVQTTRSRSDTTPSADYDRLTAGVVMAVAL